MKNRNRAKSAKVRDRAATTKHIFSILHKWGIHTLGELTALDKEQIGLRLGPEAIRLWERAQGKTTRLLELTEPPESFEETFEFENEIEMVEPLLFMLRRFLQQLSLRLDALYLVAKDLTLRITFTNKTSYERCFKIPEPTNDNEVLFRMLHTHLEQFKSECPIVAVSLTAQPVKPAHQQFGLFETALRDPGQLYETLARLTALLGTDRVGTPVLEETHRPDAFRIEPFSWDLPESPNELSAMIGPALRRFRGEFPSPLKEAVAARQGPYLASGDWWDDKSWTRAEWDLQLENGALCRCRERDGGWVVEGVYD
ncbi:MAG: hypothetical protein ABJB22_00470 [Verrucomicrobiota bacterium]